MEAARALYTNRMKPISWEEAFEILTSNDTETYFSAAVPPVKPHAGEVYLFKSMDEVKKCICT